MKLQELNAAAERLRIAKRPVTTKYLWGETGYLPCSLYRKFGEYPDYATAIGCQRRKFIPLREFVRRMYRAARIIRKRGWLMTVPALAEASELNDKRVRSRLEAHPRLKVWLGVVASPTTGRYAAAERRR